MKYQDYIWNIRIAMLSIAACVLLIIILLVNSISLSKQLAEAKELQEDFYEHSIECEELMTEAQEQVQALSEIEGLTLVKLGDFEATAYCACIKCCGKTNGITASGTKVKAGRTIAVDPKVIPLGTKVVIEFKDGTKNVYIAEDTGGAIKGNRIDIYFKTHEEALNFGRQDIKVYTIMEG